MMMNPAETLACEAERRRVARIGSWLFRHRGWLPVPFLLVPLVVEGVQTATTWTIGLSMVVLGEFVRLAGVAAAGTVTRRRSRDVQRLVTYGAFSCCRNPLYVGNFLIWSGFIVISGVFWFLPLATVIFAIEYSFIVWYEEGVLESIFGDEYLHYKKSTPRWLPRLNGFRTNGEHQWLEAFWSERSTALQYALLIGVFLLKDQYWYADPPEL